MPERGLEPLIDSPQLGLATTEELLRELIARFTPFTTRVQRAIALAEMLGGLDAADREYRTVDNA